MAWSACRLRLSDIWLGRTGNLWSVVYINAKWIYISETLACTIRECATVRSVLHVTSTFLLISWCSGAANVRWTTIVWYYYLKYVKINCKYASTEIISKYHHPNSSIFPNLDWNISSLSITCYVETFSIPYSFGILGWG